MDQLNSEVPGHVSLDLLCAGALSELEKLSYSRRTLRRYRLVWQHLSAFSRELNLGDAYSRDLAMRFEEAYGLRDGECIKRTDAWRRPLVFSVRFLDDCARTGGMVRFIVATQGLGGSAGHAHAVARLRAAREGSMPSSNLDPARANAGDREVPRFSGIKERDESGSDAARRYRRLHHLLS